jgi:hypothetical protein
VYASIIYLNKIARTRIARTATMVDSRDDALSAKTLLAPTSAPTIRTREAVLHAALAHISSSKEKVARSIPTG